MKILYVTCGHFWGSTWPYAYIDNYLAATLEQLGIETRIFDFFSRINIYNSAFKEDRKKLKIDDLRYLEILKERASSDLPQEIIEFEPDLVLHIVGMLSIRTLKVLRKMKIKTAIWFLDDPQEIDHTSKQGQFYDYVFTVEEAAVPRHKNAFHLPLGCLPRIHKTETVEDKYKSDLCFIGVPFPSRVKLFDELADSIKGLNVKIIGGGKNIGGVGQDPWLWKSKLKRLDLLDKFILDEVVPPAEAVKYYNGAKINLNIHRGAVDERFKTGNTQSLLPQQVNGRTFEIAGCGAFQLIDNQRKSLSAQFKVGEEIIAYTDLPDLKKKIEFYLKAENARSRVAQNSQKRAYAEHTYANRLKKIIEVSS